jgi:photosystem II stability/assembly factor-like uncharacterized protein
MKIKLLLIINLLFMTLIANAQWKEANINISMGQVYSLLTNGNKLYAGTNDGVYISSDNGKNWTAVNTGLTNKNVRKLTKSGNNIISGTYDGGVFMSSDGKTWKAINNGLTNKNVQALAVSGNNIFVGTKGGVFLSSNNGSSWKAINNGLTSIDIKCLLINGSNILAGTFNGGVFLSTDNGENWSAINGNLTGRGLMTKALASNGSDIYLINLNGIFISTDNGTSWNEINKDIENTDIRSIIVDGEKLFLGASGGDIFFTQNNGEKWSKYTLGPEVKYGNPGTSTTSLTIVGSNIFAGQDRGVLVWVRELSEVVEK